MLYITRSFQITYTSPPKRRTRKDLVILRYKQGRPSSQCHRDIALVVFLPRPKVRAYFGHPTTKILDSPKWHWLILAPMGALGYKGTIYTECTMKETYLYPPPFCI